MDNKEMEKFTPLRQRVINQVLDNLTEGHLNWVKGWKMKGAPVSGMTGKKYHGVNNICLTLTAMAEGYKDNRWFTFNQIKNMGLGFKVDEEGRTLAKDKGVPLEFFSMHDKATGSQFTESSVKHLSTTAREKYIKENVYMIRKYFTVFNADVVDGLEKKMDLEDYKIDLDKINKRAEGLIDYWNENECLIHYGGDDSFYSKKRDEIFIPSRESFYSMNEFYSTIMHEISHSTGHPSRMNRELSGNFASQSYAIEELRAELSSIFLVQDLEVEMSEKELRNNSAYIASWKATIENDPNAFFKAITDADKIARYVLNREKLKKVEPYSIFSNKEGEYSVRMLSSDGRLYEPFEGTVFSSEIEVSKALARQFPDKQDFMEQVSEESLNNLYMNKREERAAKLSKGLDTKPSEMEDAKRFVPRKVDMTGRGIDSLKRLSDKQLVEKGFTEYGGERFSKLYKGESIYNHEIRDEKSLMVRIAIFATEGVDQILRVFESSGQYREDKKETYARMALDAVAYVEEMKSNDEKSAKARMGRDYKGSLNTKTK